MYSFKKYLAFTTQQNHSGLKDTMKEAQDWAGIQIKRQGKPVYLLEAVSMLILPDIPYEIIPLKPRVLTTMETDDEAEETQVHERSTSSRESLEEKDKIPLQSPQDQGLPQRQDQPHQGPDQKIGRPDPGAEEEEFRRKGFLYRSKGPFIED